MMKGGHAMKTNSVGCEILFLAYMLVRLSRMAGIKIVVMKCLDNLSAWADRCFRTKPGAE
jgi:hypothetical protein